MEPLSCEALRDLWDDYRIDNLPEGGRERVGEHLAACPSCREFTALLGKLSNAVNAAEMDPLVRRRIAVAAAESGSPRARAVAARPRFAAAAAVAVACAAVVAIVAWPGGDGETVAPAPRVAPAAIAAPAPPSAGPAGERIEAAERRYVEVFAGTGLAMAAGASVTAERSGPGEARFLLHAGRVVAVVGPHGPGFRFVVVTPSGAEVEARGTVFAVEADAGGRESVRVSRGIVDVRGVGQVPVALGAGQELRIGGTAAAPAGVAALEADRALAFGGAPPDAEESAAGEGAARPGETREQLARQARAYRRARRFEAAAAAYERLISNYAGSESAKNGLVALGEIELDVLGSFDEALAHFDRYLAVAPGGYLAEAATAGRARALSRAGRLPEAARAAGEYLEEFPDGANAAEMARLRDGGKDRGSR